MQPRLHIHALIPLARPQAKRSRPRYHTTPAAAELSRWGYHPWLVTSEPTPGKVHTANLAILPAAQCGEMRTRQSRAAGWFLLMMHFIISLPDFTHLFSSFSPRSLSLSLHSSWSLLSTKHRSRVPLETFSVQHSPTDPCHFLNFAGSRMSAPPPRSNITSP